MLLAARVSRALGELYQGPLSLTHPSPSLSQSPPVSDHSVVRVSKRGSQRRKGDVRYDVRTERGEKKRKKTRAGRTRAGGRRF